MAFADLPCIALTCGEPAGVGPELCARLGTLDPHRPLADVWGARIVVLGDHDWLCHQVSLIGKAVRWQIFDPKTRPPQEPGVLEVLPHPLPVAPVWGKPDPRNASQVLALLDTAIEGCLSGRFQAMVTAPLHKGIINEAGVPFSGHTEYLAEKTGTPKVVMMLAGAGLRVALVTTHLPLSKVPAAITPETLEQTLRILHDSLKRDFGLPSPRILVAGLNPHAGEGGHLGHEENTIIIPVLERLRAEGLGLLGPFPADTLFVEHTLRLGDAVLAMYHDQGLPVLKRESFGAGINVTLGLPIVRTSVDHGTALDIAGQGRAHPGSLFEAIGLAVELARHRQRFS
jgi:4-hydroxythreonine-4-phosphate dehydrogenase